MSTVATLEAINTGLAVIRLLTSVQVDINDLVMLQKKAESEGREISKEELQQLSNRAQDAIDLID